MATGKIPMAFDSYQDYTLTKDPSSTNWTLARYHACRQGKTAYLQIVFTVNASEGTSQANLTTLPEDLIPGYNVEAKANSLETGTDYNVVIYGGSHARRGNVEFSRRPTETSGNGRFTISYPLP